MTHHWGDALDTGEQYDDFVEREADPSRDMNSAADIVKIDDADIRGEFMRLPADIAWWAQHHADAIMRAKIAKARAEAFEARSKAEILRQAKEGEKRVSDIAATTIVRARPDWLTRQENLAEAEAQVALAKEILRALGVKRDALIELGATARREMVAVGMGGAASV